jgi:non-specific serine/threonine protein kinase
VEEAERFHDGERAARARDELAALTAELAGAVGLGGRDRKAASNAERARVSVTKAIKSAITKIAGHDPNLGDYLSRSIKTGTFCSYDPPARGALEWRL